MLENKKIYIEYIDKDNKVRYLSFDEDHQFEDISKKEFQENTISYFLIEPESHLVFSIDDLKDKKYPQKMNNFYNIKKIYLKKLYGFKMRKHLLSIILKRGTLLIENYKSPTDILNFCKTLPENIIQLDSINIINRDEVDDESFYYLKTEILPNRQNDYSFVFRFNDDTAPNSISSITSLETIKKFINYPALKRKKMFLKTIKQI